MIAVGELDTSSPSSELTVDDLYRQHGTLLARWTLRLIGPDGDAEDALQEVLFQVHRSLPTFRRQSRVTTWLYGLTLRVVQRMRRRERVRRWLFGAITDEEAEEVPARDPGPSADLERRQASQALYRALDQLSEKHRTAFLLFEMEQLGTKPGTVWVWLHRARTRLRELMEEQP
jgi:RNA polymerase sigma-70 factor (ECF subfamily)